MIGWAIGFAWRDARGDRKHLFVYLATIVAGVAALVAIRSFAANLESAIDVEAKSLLGADLEIYGRQPFDEAAETLVAEIEGDRSPQVETSSMVLFPTQGGSRLATIRALSPGFPYYGRIETEPAAAAAAFPQPGTALVDSTLMTQFGVEVGDPIRVGEVTFRIAGRLVRIPGEVPTASLIGPRIFIPLDDLEATRLIRPGSRARYSVFFRLTLDDDQVVDLVGGLGDRLRALSLEAESAAYRARRVGRALDDLGTFLYLAGLAALLLGAVGVGSSMHLYARSKVRVVATLRCVGARPLAPVLAFALQALALGAIGAGLGAAVGVTVQRLLPWALESFLPVQVEFGWSTAAVAEGFATGVVVSVLFALLPLIGLRRVTPSAALRLYVAPAAAWRDPLAWMIAVIAFTGVAVVAYLGSGDWRLVGGLLGGLTAALGALAVAAALTRGAVRRWLPATWPFVVRQGLANLYRPRNQTLVVMLSLGFGVFILGTVALVQTTLLGVVSGFSLESDANMVLFDIQPDQLAGVEQELRAASMPLLQTTPVVPMRLARIGDRRVADIPRGDLPGWLLRRVYNSSYRAELAPTEQVIAGEWVGRVDGYEVGSATEVPVSLEQGMAHDLRIGVGDRLAFDVQGIEIPVIVGSLRDVDWEQVSPNFFVVFPAGVLEVAPQQIVIVTRTDSEQQAAGVQRALVERFSNLSVLDLALVFATIETVLAQVNLAIRTIALFCVAAGFGVLVVAVIGSRQARMREAVLLRTLGASRQQILAIGAAEYLLLGGMSAACGLLLAVVAAGILAVQVFEAQIAAQPATLAGLLLATVLSTVVIGLWGHRGVTSVPPLRALRAER